MKNQARTILVLLSGIALGAVAVPTVDSMSGNRLRSCLKYVGLSDLSDCGETRIAGIAQELFRRSPKLEKNFLDFKECIKKPKCDRQKIFDERNKKIKTEWQKNFYRFTNKYDWQSGQATQTEREIFLLKLMSNRYGVEHFCTPIIRYIIINPDDKTGPKESKFAFRGFDCSSEPSIPEPLK